MRHRTEGDFDYSDSYDTDENGVKRINLARHAKKNPNLVKERDKPSIAHFCECHTPDVDDEADVDQAEAAPAAA